MGTYDTQPVLSVFIVNGTMTGYDGDGDDAGEW